MSEENKSGEGIVYINEDGEKLQITQSHADLLNALRFSNKLKILVVITLAVVGIIFAMGFFQTTIVVDAMEKLVCAPP